MVSVDYEDVMGSVSVDMESSIEKTRLDQHGGRVASAGLQRNGKIYYTSSVGFRVSNA